VALTRLRLAAAQVVVQVAGFVIAAGGDQLGHARRVAAVLPATATTQPQTQAQRHPHDAVWSGARRMTPTMACSTTSTDTWTCAVATRRRVVCCWIIVTVVMPFTLATRTCTMSTPRVMA